VLTAVGQNGDVSQYTSCDLKEYRDFALRGAMNEAHNGQAIQYATAALKDDREVCL
jgi:hypothetical protein